MMTTAPAIDRVVQHSVILELTNSKLPLRKSRDDAGDRVMNLRIGRPCFIRYSLCHVVLTSTIHKNGQEGKVLVF